MVFPTPTFDDVGQYAKEKSGCSSTSKAYKFMAGPGYLYDIKGNINWLNYFVWPIITSSDVILHSFICYWWYKLRTQWKWVWSAFDQWKRARHPTS